MLLTPAQIKPQSFESRRNSFFFTRGGCVTCLRACLGARLLPQSSQYPNLWDGADRVGGQLRGDKECPFSGVTKTGRVWRKVPESGVRSVGSNASSLSSAKEPFLLSEKKQWDWVQSMSLCLSQTIHSLSPSVSRGMGRWGEGVGCRSVTGFLLGFGDWFPPDTVPM